MPFDRFAHRKALLEHGHAVRLASQNLIDSGHCLDGMILASIDAGLDTRDAIIASIPRHVRYSHRQVAAVLDERTGPSPDKHLCYRDENKVYHLHLAPRSEGVRKRAPRKRKVAQPDAAF